MSSDIKDFLCLACWGPWKVSAAQLRPIILDMAVASLLITQLSVAEVLNREKTSAWTRKKGSPTAQLFDK